MREKYTSFMVATCVWLLVGGFGSFAVAGEKGKGLKDLNTITDSETGLMWEKKTNDGDIHDVNNVYTWSTGSPWDPDGTAFTEFLNTLNTAPCFAGHCDWRLPKVSRDADAGMLELETIVDCSFGSPCIDPIFGPTAAFDYWSATTDAVGPNVAWVVDFFSGATAGGVGVGSLDKDDSTHVRAVRTGP